MVIQIASLVTFNTILRSKKSDIPKIKLKRNELRIKKRNNKKTELMNKILFYDLCTHWVYLYIQFKFHIDIGLPIFYLIFFLTEVTHCAALCYINVSQLLTALISRLQIWMSWSIYCCIYRFAYANLKIVKKKNLFFGCRSSLRFTWFSNIWRKGNFYNFYFGDWCVTRLLKCSILILQLNEQRVWQKVKQKINFLSGSMW